MPTSIRFQKPALSVRDLLSKYEERGMLIEDKETAAHYLRYISYYRLGPYVRHFQVFPNDVDHKLKPGTTFGRVLDLYIFDRELRLLFMDALERIEVSVRTCICNHMALRYGPHWFMQPARFLTDYKHDELISAIKARTESNSDQPAFARHYYTKYDTPELPPSWMIAEVLSLGAWSKMYPKLADPADRLAIAKELGQVLPPALASFLQRLTVLRNICAHHGLLWSHRFQSSPFKVEMENGVILNGDDGKALHFAAALVQTFLAVVAPRSRWPFRLLQLIKRHPQVPVAIMGFRFNWYKNPFWRIPAEPEFEI